MHTLAIQYTSEFTTNIVQTQFINILDIYRRLPEFQPKHDPVDAFRMSFFSNEYIYRCFSFI